MPGPPNPGARPQRTDARRNRQQVLDAARDAFVDHGPAVALEVVADRAGVGIGTVYRHFAGRRALIDAVARDAVERSADAAERASGGGRGAFEALVAYLHEVLDLRIAAVVPTLLGHLDLTGSELVELRDRAADGLQRLVDGAHAEGGLAAEVTFGDIGLLLIRLSRPLPGRFPAPLDQALAHRHLDLLIEGLRPRADRTGPVPGPALSLQDLRRIDATGATGDPSAR